MKPFSPVVPEAFAGIYKNYQYAPAVRVGDDVHVSGVVGFGEDGSFPADFEGQARNVFRLLEVILTECGGTLGDVFSMTSYHVGDLPTQMGAFIAEKSARLGAPHPAWTGLSVSGLAVPEALLEVSVIARLGA
jgi:enamine deaminase RidA (YjgF/YER057c/UK114 family)